MQTRAAVLTAFPAERPYARSRPLSVETVTLADPRRDEVLVRIAAAGLCHSDLSVINGDRPRPMPMVLGHEAAGVVERVGEGVDDLRPGDRVVMVFVPSCGGCAPCAEGRPALCEPGAKANAAGELLGGGRRLSGAAGGEIHHHIGVSAFAEHAVVSRRSLVKVADAMPLERAALFGCAVLTGVGAVVNTAGVRAGQSVAVIGLGGVGLAAVMGALAVGAGEVIAIDVAADKVALARELGATAGFVAGADTAAEVREATRGGVDVAVETAGVAPAFDSAYAATRRGGVTVTASLPNPAARVSLAPVTLVAEERTIRGSYLGGGVPSRDIPRYMRLNLAGRLPVERLHTGTDRLDDINAGFDALAEGRAVRRLVAMD